MSADDRLPVGTFFRLAWATGRVGVWHQAQEARHERVQRCGCGVGVGWFRMRQRVTVQTTPLPEQSDCCLYLRRWAALAAPDPAPLNPELPGVNMYITTCLHGVDLRFTPRCYLCKPAAPDPAPLNVERLRKAIRAVGYRMPYPDEDYMEAIAREYAKEQQP